MEKYFHCIHGKSLRTICFTTWNLHIVSFCNALQTFDARLDHAENGISDGSRVGQEIVMESYFDSLCSV